eukprot:SM000193S05157  [mRNA]  locus=s193:15069:20925:+ [translate_table: standard]
MAPGNPSSSMAVMSVHGNDCPSFIDVNRNTLAGQSELRQVIMDAPSGSGSDWPVAADGDSRAAWRAQLVAMGFGGGPASEAAAACASLEDAVDYILAGDTAAPAMLAMEPPQLLPIPSANCTGSATDSRGSGWEAAAMTALQTRFGFEELKPFQREALAAWAAGRDCFVLAATGSGKSLCFQLPALVTGGTVVVVSPLISLMHDQCVKLAAAGIAACFLGSGQPDAAIETAAIEGAYDVIYACPETIPRLVRGLQELARGRSIALFAVDEAHCVSKWGHDFRPAYRKLSLLKTSFTPRALGDKSARPIPVMALTATATPTVREDVLTSLRMGPGAAVVLTSFFRPNLAFKVHHSKTKRPASYARDFSDLREHYLGCSNGRRQGSAADLSSELNLGMATALQEESDSAQARESGEDNDEDRRCLEVDADEDRVLPANDLGVLSGTCQPGATCASNTAAEGEGPSIVYVPTRKEAERLAAYLNKWGIKCAAYHAKLPRAHLQQVHCSFQAGVLQVVVATIAFGMGIDKANVRRVIHYGWPQSLEAYYQEAGRGGRDGRPCDCILYCDMTMLPSLLPSKRSPEQAQHALHMLTECFRYGVTTSKCRARILLSYFGEELQTQVCNMCDVCTDGTPPLEDVTAEAVSLISSCSQGGTNRLARAARGVAQGPKDIPLYWRGLARILSDRGLLREQGGKITARVSGMRHAEATEAGLAFLRDHHDTAAQMTSSEVDPSAISQVLGDALLVHPEGDMLAAARQWEEETQEQEEGGEEGGEGGSRRRQTYRRAGHGNGVGGEATAEWGRGWADPDVRRQRLARFRPPGGARKRLAKRMYAMSKKPRKR